MEIRRAEDKDIKQCVELSQIKEFEMPGAVFPDEEYFNESLSKVFLVAEEGEKIVGFILGFNLTIKDVYLDLLVVKNKFRSKGVGKKLIEKFREELKLKEVKEYFLIAPKFNNKTISFYENLGLKKGKEYVLFCERFK